MSKISEEITEFIVISDVICPNCGRKTRTLYHLGDKLYCTECTPSRIGELLMLMHLIEEWEDANTQSTK